MTQIPRKPTLSLSLKWFKVHLKMCGPSFFLSFLREVEPFSHSFFFPRGASEREDVSPGELSPYFLLQFLDLFVLVPGGVALPVLLDHSRSQVGLVRETFGECK